MYKTAFSVNIVTRSRNYSYYWSIMVCVKWLWFFGGQPMSQKPGEVTKCRNKYESTKNLAFIFLDLTGIHRYLGVWTWIRSWLDNNFSIPITLKNFQVLPLHPGPDENLMKSYKIKRDLGLTVILCVHFIITVENFHFIYVLSSLSSASIGKVVLFRSKRKESDHEDKMDL